MSTRSYQPNNDGVDILPLVRGELDGGNVVRPARAAVIWPSIAFMIVFIVVCGLIYPAVATFAGGLLFPKQAEGSLIRQGDRIVGSSLVAQPFAAAGYFRPRPSSSKYDPMSMAGSNMAPSNPDLRKLIADRTNEVAKREGINPMDVPADLVTASGSSIDPDISPAGAAVQVARVAKERGLTTAEVESVVAANTSGQTFGVLGQTRVNVLKLNLALDALEPLKH
jgi:K+-transporting ATPase ATPase C chain